MTYLTVSQVAERLNCSQANIYSLLEKGELGCVKIGANGGGLRVSDVMLEAFLESRREHHGKNVPPVSARTSPFKHLDGDRLLSAWRQQGNLSDPQGGGNAPS